MKLFLDTANLESIKRAHDTGFLDGVTTNPSKIAESGKKFLPVLEEICQVFSGPVSAEPVAHTADEIVRQSVDVASIAPNINIKVPLTLEGLKAGRILIEEKGIKVNVTMIFAADQAFLAMKLKATYVSIVLSRLDNILSSSDDLIRDTMTIKRNYGYKAEILGGSIKTRASLLSCLKEGIDVVTIPEALFFMQYDHPLTTQGLEEFDRAWQKVNHR